MRVDQELKEYQSLLKWIKRDIELFEKMIERLKKNKQMDIYSLSFGNFYDDYVLWGRNPLPAGRWLLRCDKCYKRINGEIGYFTIYKNKREINYFCNEKCYKNFKMKDKK